MTPVKQFTGQELQDALKTKNKLETLGVPAVMHGCKQNGYTLSVAPRFVQAAKQALDSTEVIQ